MEYRTRSRIVAILGCTAFAAAFSDVFILGIPFAVLALIVACFLKESPLRGSAREEAAGEGLQVS